MRTKHFILLAVLLIGSVRVITQTLNDSDLLEMRQSRFASLSTLNDIYQFEPTDKYYTNGLHVQYADGWFNKNWTNALLLNPLSQSKSSFLLNVGQDIYTPVNIFQSAIDSTDVPYSGALLATLIRQANNPAKGFRWESKFVIGIQGPASGAGAVQYWYHDISNNPEPNGWHNQIGNGLILDYEVAVERLLPIQNEFVEWNVNAAAHVGTYLNYATVGTLAKIGWFNYSYSDYNGRPNTFASKASYTTDDLRWRKKSGKVSKKRKTRVNGTWQLYGIIGANAKALAYDGRVQGSLIPFQSSPYLWSSSDYEHFNVQLVLGATLSYKNVLLQFVHREQRDVYKGFGAFSWAEIKAVVVF